MVTSARHQISTLGGGAAKKPNTGVVEITQKNIKQEYEESRVPILLYFHITNNPDVVAYTETLKHQVTEANRRYQQTIPFDSGDTSPDRGLAIKLCLVDCQREHVIAERYHISPHQFPLILFCWKKECLDRLSGMVTEAQVKEAIDAFVDFVAEQIRLKPATASTTGNSSNAKSGNGINIVSTDGRIKRTDNDDENAMTLLQVAHQKLRLKEIVKAQELYGKALKLATESTDQFKVSIGFDTKKRTDEMWLKLRRNGHYNAMAQARAGLAMCEMANRNFAAGLEMVTKLREDFPFATKDLKDVTEAIVRIELVFASKFDLDKDNYVTLMKFEDVEEDPVRFYEQHVKLAVAHVFDKKHRAAIIECVRLIRSEAKLLPALKEAFVPRPSYCLR
eukprot:CAMPEP_0176473544 /NCGR_PEP_ID=MMETSP0127-20121128/42372_1 /TAXON_ID=938130 /ORGANISM="Platyophrya macrostoma, Strain WH" /LENGTH=391 /DNA_ID=CAMNT_0017868565 /DNA_START=204 /DNA_END=1379 /DNA_ORIENTATION=+